MGSNGSKSSNSWRVVLPTAVLVERKSGVGRMRERERRERMMEEERGEERRERNVGRGENGIMRRRRGKEVRGTNRKRER